MIKYVPFCINLGDFLAFFMFFRRFFKNRMGEVLGHKAVRLSFINLALSIMGKKIIKCSQCDREFETGFDYRMHWEKHLDEYFKKIKGVDIQPKE